MGRTLPTYNPGDMPLVYPYPVLLSAIHRSFDKSPEKHKAGEPHKVDAAVELQALPTIPGLNLAMELPFERSALVSDKGANGKYIYR